MFEKKIAIGEIKATVHTETGRDVIAQRVILPKFVNDGEYEFELWFQFTRVLSQSSDVSVPFAWPSVGASVEELRAARDAFFCLPGPVVRAWMDAVSDVNTPPGNPDLSPNASEKKDENETPPEDGLNSEA